MTATRETDVERLSDYRTDPGQGNYLHYRSLFPALKEAATHAKGRLLDIGCGNKPYRKMFAGAVSEHVGCDVVQSSLQEVDVICPADALDFADGVFDSVLCTQVIEHVANHGGLIAEAFRVLRPGGVLIISGPMYWPLHEEPYDFFRFTEHGFRYLLEKAGFVLEQIVRNGGKWALCGQAILHAVHQTRLERPMTIRVVNRVFGWLDDRHPSRTNPMNYVAVARKP